MAVAIRTAATDDVADVAAAYEWLFAPPGSPVAGWDPARAATTLRELLADEAATVLVADAGGALAGFATVYTDIRSVRFGPRAWVEDLAVHPERRSQGIGKGLLDAAKAWAREHGASHLELDSALTREDAHRFYEREEPSWRSMCFGWALPE